MELEKDSLPGPRVDEGRVRRESESEREWEGARTGMSGGEGDDIGRGDWEQKIRITFPTRCHTRPKMPFTRIWFMGLQRAEVRVWR